MPYLVYWTNKPRFKTKIPRTHQIHKAQWTPISICITHLKHKVWIWLYQNTMTLLKHIDKTTPLIPYEQLYIQSYYHHKWLIPEQHISEHNPMYQLIYNLHNMSNPTWLTDQYSNINMTKNQSHPNPAKSQAT
jgi:hypothetical protein